MIGKIIAQASKNKKAQAIAQKQVIKYRNLIRQEAIIGGTIFGPIPKGHRREFFCLDKHSWVWHEEWIDKTGIRQVKNTRYDIRPSGIVKMQNGVGYTAISPTEAQHLLQAVKIYEKRVMKELYGITV